MCQLKDEEKEYNIAKSQDVFAFVLPRERERELGSVCSRSVRAQAGERRMEKTSRSVSAHPTAPRVSNEEHFIAGHGEEKEKLKEGSNIPPGAEQGGKSSSSSRGLHLSLPLASPCTHGRTMPAPHHASHYTHHRLPTPPTEQRLIGRKMQVSVDITVTEKEQELIKILLKIPLLGTSAPSEAAAANHQALRPMQQLPSPPLVAVPFPKQPTGLTSRLPSWLSLLTSTSLIQEVAG